MSGADDVLARVEGLAEEVPGAIAELERQRDEITQRINQLRGLRNVLEPRQSRPGHSKPKPKPKPKSSGAFYTANGVGEAAILALAERIVASGRHTFTVRDFARKGEASGRTHKAFAVLRELEFLARTSTGRGNIPARYAVLDADAIQKLGSRNGG